tara:strand:- start:1867 stop:2478 length:612 start_codon:yes stop_codon:yes gene_type:complete
MPFNWELIAHTALKSLPWPITVLIIAWWFRRDIRQVLGRLKSFQGGQFRADFDKLNHLSNSPETEISQELEDEERMPSSESEASEFFDTRDLLGIADVRPTAAIVEAWRTLEATMLARLSSSAAQKFETRNGRKQISGYQLTRGLQTQNLLSNADAKIADELRIIRNKAAHSVDSEPSTAQAKQYIREARKLVAKLSSSTAIN